MNKYIYALAAMAVSSLTPSCCSIMRGSTQDVGIASNPAGATVTINGEQKGVTPTTVKLDRDKEYSVLLTKEGYEPYGATLTHSLSGWVWGNVFIGGLVGLAIDAGTGSMYNISPENVQAEMTQAKK